MPVSTETIGAVDDARVERSFPQHYVVLLISLERAAHSTYHRRVKTIVEDDRCDSIRRRCDSRGRRLSHRVCAAVAAAATASARRHRRHEKKWHHLRCSTHSSSSSGCHRRTRRSNLFSDALTAAARVTAKGQDI